MQIGKIVNLSQIDKRPAALISFTVFAVNVLAFFPGYMSGDSLFQLLQARTLVFSDWHPPMMAWVWSIFDAIVPGPALFLVFNITVMQTGLYLTYRHFQKISYSWVILLLPTLPMIQNFAGVIWKDTALAAAMCLLAALALEPNAKYRLFTFLLVAAYAMSLRHNAIFTVAPILIFFFYKRSAFTFARGSISRALIATILVSGVTLVSQQLFVYQVLKSTQTYPTSQIYIDDLSSFSLKTGVSEIPGVSIGTIEQCEREDSIFHAICLSRNAIKQPISAVLNEKLFQKWITLITSRPNDYIEIRLNAFGEMLGINTWKPFYVWQSGIEENSLISIDKPNGLTLVVKTSVLGAGTLAGFLFLPIFWLVLSLIFFGMALLSKFESRHRLFVLALIGSATLHWLPYLISAPARDFRYFYWPVLAISTSGLISLLATYDFVRWKKIESN